MSSLTEVDVLTNINSLFTVIGYENSNKQILNSIYTSNDGYNYRDLKVGKNLNINKIEKLNTTIYIATASGLYTDAGTFYSLSPVLSLIDVDSSIDSEDLVINDLNANADRMAIAANNGNYYILEQGEIVANEGTALRSIQRILLVGSDVWAFGYNLLQVSSIDFPIRLTTGSPI